MVQRRSLDGAAADVEGLHAGAILGGGAGLGRGGELLAKVSGFRGQVIVP